MAILARPKGHLMVFQSDRRIRKNGSLKERVIPQGFVLFFVCFICFSSVPLMAEDGKAIKIICWNVLYGFNHGKSIAQGSQWIHEQKSDVVALQELNGFTEEKLGMQAEKWGHAYAVTHKESGFPVGLTSNRPIEVLEKQSKGFHHGFLHCKTYGIHFFVVHWWPGKYAEADWILKKVAPLLESNKKVVILGDFNGCSRKDETFLIQNALKRERDYVYVDKLESQHFVDIVHKHDKKAKVSCPSPITIPKWSKDLKDLELKRYRIDFIFANEDFAKMSRSGTISLERDVERVSDHYPVIVDFFLEVDGSKEADEGEADRQR